MSKRVGQVGFSQRVRLEWLEQTANLVLAGNEKTAINDALQSLLKDRVSIGGQAERGNREKIITILMKTWLVVPKDLESFRLRGLDLLKRIPRTDHLVIHWGMVAVVYPFWLSVGAQVGRLLRIQGSAATAQVQRRVREKYGERETVSRAVRRVLRSYVDWNVIQKTTRKGVYGAGTNLPVKDAQLIAWLAEAHLSAASKRSVSLRDLFSRPEFFPFQFKQMTAKTIADASPGLDVLRHGSSDDHLILRGALDNRTP
jgi:hypothetical protein